MKNILKKLLVFVLLLATLTSCSEYHAPITPPGGGEGSSGDNGGTGGGDGEDLADDPNAFSVSIMYDGEQYIPKASAEMKARWSDGYSVHVADFGKDGFARIGGLDGDYQVSLLNLPGAYVYDVNGYVATNNQRHVVINIYKPIRTQGYGSGPYDSIKISKTGVYRVEVSGAEHKVFFEYAPSESGKYSVESWISVSEGNYNPKCDVWVGTIAYKTFSYTLDDGGISSVIGVNSGYTKNFKYEVEISDENFGEGGTGGQAVFSFAVHADSKNGAYPAYIDIAVKLNGSLDPSENKSNIIIPEENFVHTPEYDKSKYTFVGAETSTVGVEGRYEFDGDMWQLFEKDEDINGDGIGDGDGYYHLYDPEKYPENGGYGPILYAKISLPCRFIDDAFTTIEGHGNKALTIYGTENHKLFIEGIMSLLVDQPGDAGMYFCLPECPCMKEHECDDTCSFPCEKIRTCIGVCPESCERCDKDCRKLPDDIMDKIYYCHPQCKHSEEGDYKCDGICTESCEGCTELCKRAPADYAENYSDYGYVRMLLPSGFEVLMPRQLLGYAAFTNSDGVYAVTEELKYFLQGYSVSQRMFADGNGWVEENPTVKVDAEEDDQWLFACGYYKEK